MKHFFSRLTAAWLISGVALVTLTPAQAQTQNKYHAFYAAAHLGRLGIERAMVEPPPPSSNTSSPGVSVEESLLMYGASVGTDVKLVSLNAEQSIGLSLNAALSVSNRDYSGIGFEIPLLVWLPEYVTWRWGARSSRKSQQDFGVGIGAGYRFGFVLQQGFHAPCAMVEGIYVLGNHDVLLRLSTDLGARRFDRPYGNEAIAAHELHFASLSLGFTY